ncbi:short-chain dehydrogenase/reductase SDR [Listeria floridensis FSL S10-1187]|uniref:Short-chain dehydrogenase/reductase SDR n=1 Tax=Listeria floridensis FSL S10-1187 TaxID=1265817 RepID=A0ABP3AXW6_9LIST|nr:SDR family oxidoreductase [Listeria floridensis]EUJ30292.1 short-chain dehydrogenase/reductase SDR [Listeria floridensis FSL S10-1187]
MRKTAVITGSATGIGRGSAIQLAQDGFDLVLADWNTKDGEKTAELCRAEGVLADFIYADMGIEKDAERVVDFARNKYSKIDFYLNNQGVVHDPKLLHEITEEEADYNIHTNIKGTFFGLKYMLRAMLEQEKGHIVLVSSSSGIRSETGFGMYSATKHAVVGLAQDAAMEYARNNIRVNTICPGGIMTGMTEKIGAYMMQHQFVQPKSAAGLLREGGLGEVNEITGLVSFLASEKSSFMTGAILSVDGGNTL